MGRGGGMRWGVAAAALLALGAACGPAASVPQTPGRPGWTAELDMYGLEIEIAARLDEAAAQHRIAPARAAALKAELQALRDDEAARRAARDFPQPEYDRVQAALYRLAGQVPDIAIAPDPPTPDWARGLGMKELEAEIAARADDAVAQHKLPPARAAAIRAEVARLAADEQAQREVRNFPALHFHRIQAALLKLADALPDIPPLHPPEEPPAAGWSQDHANTPLDLSGYRLSFDEAFDRLDIAPDGGRGRWYAPVHTDFGSAHFLPPGPGGPFALDKADALGLGGSALAISARRAGDGWTSGLIQTVDSHGRGFSQQYGYFEMRARLPRGKATWPAFWLLTANGYTDPTLTRGEIDVLEQYGSAPDKIHSSVHLWPASARNAGGLPGHWYKSLKVWVGDMSSAYHRYGVMLTPEWVITYYDGAELARFPTPPQYRTPVYMLVDLAMHEKDLAQATSPSVMRVDYVRAYARR